MPTTTLEAREQIISDLGAATVQIGFAVGCLGAAYELLDELTADRLESELFRPAQRAFAKARHASGRFAERYGLSPSTREAPSPGLASQGVKALVEKAVTASNEGSRRIAELQDSMLPIEAGDAELRAGLSEVRESLAEIPTATLQFLRTLGR